MQADSKRMDANEDLIMDEEGNIIPLETEEDVLEVLMGVFLWNHNSFPCEHDRDLLARAAHCLKCEGDCSANCANPRMHGHDWLTKRSDAKAFLPSKNQLCIVDFWFKSISLVMFKNCIISERKNRFWARFNVWMNFPNVSPGAKDKVHFNLW